MTREARRNAQIINVDANADYRNCTLVQHITSGFSVGFAVQTGRLSLSNCTVWGHGVDGQPLENAQICNPRFAEGEIAYELADWPGDCNADGWIMLADLSAYDACLLGPAVSTVCPCADADGDTDVDLADFAIVQATLGQ